MVLWVGSQSGFLRRGLWPFKPEPISVTTRPTLQPCETACSNSRATCESRFGFCSAELTRASIATSDGPAGGSSTRIIPFALCRAGTGSFPALNGREAV
jgi:hypothetical protein